MSKTRQKGVSPHPKRTACWFAQINCAGKTYNLGLFDAEQGGEEAAARAFDNAAYYASKYRGEKRDFNFPDDWKGETVPAPTQTTTELLAKIATDESTKAWATKAAARRAVEARKTATAAARLRKTEARALIHEINRAVAFPDEAPRQPDSLKKLINSVFGAELCQIGPSAPPVTRTQLTQIATALTTPQPTASVSAPNVSSHPVNAPEPIPAPARPALQLLPDGQKARPLRRLSVLPAATPRPSNLAGRPRRFRQTVPRIAATPPAGSTKTSTVPPVPAVVETPPPDDPMPNRPDAAGTTAPAKTVKVSPATPESLTEMLTGPGATVAAVDYRAPRRPKKGTATGPVLFSNETNAL